VVGGNERRGGTKGGHMLLCDFLSIHDVICIIIT
jgi:hypothetical protein